MNFNTTNMTFRQLMANGLSYRVPQFQRDYSWDVDHWDDLWLDIVGLFGEESESAHYMGYLVLQSADSRSYDIIDGQQRMATLSVLMLAAVSHLMDLAVPDDPNDPQFRRAEQLRSNYIGYLDPVTLVPRSKLTLNRHNDRLYQDYLVPLERLPQRGLNASEHLLRRAFHSFKDRIKDHCGQDGQSVARFVDTAVDKLFFTVITVTDELNAFKVFETLNARGVRLSATDLLKNYLFSVVSRGGTHDAEIKTLENRWEAIVGLLGSESLPEFLRVFWNSRHRLVRKADLFKTIRVAIGDKASAFELIRDLDRQARIYGALRAPADEFWTAHERHSLTLLQMFNVRQPLSVLLAVFDRFAEDNRTGFGRFCEPSPSYPSATTSSAVARATNRRRCTIASLWKSLRAVLPLSTRRSRPFAPCTPRTQSSGLHSSKSRFARPAAETGKGCVTFCSSSRNGFPAAAMSSRARSTTLNMFCRRIPVMIGHNSMNSNMKCQPTDWAT